MKNLIFIAAAIFLLPFIGMKGTPAGNPVASQPQSSSRADNAPSKSSGQSGYISPTPGRFPIIAYSPVTDERIPTKADFDTLAACGFNCAMTLFNHDEYFDLMGEIKDLGITFIPILDNYTNRNDCDGIKEFITNTRQFMRDNDIPDSLIGGYRIKDEPAYDLFDTIASSYNAAKNADPAVMPIVNLPAEPSGNFKPQVRLQSYSSNPLKRDTMSMYLNHFYDMVHPSVWSYDYYPILYKSDSAKIEVNYEDFYYNLQLFARLSKEKGIPFWTFCESSNVRYCKIGDKNYKERPVATENHLRYEAFSALAFGAQGINYWRYSDRGDDYSSVYKNGEYMLYLTALTDSLGNCEPAWKCAQTVNREIKRYEEVFLGAELRSYSFFDSGLNTDRYVRPTDGADIPEYDGLIDIKAVSGKGVLVSHLYKNGLNHIILVNQDPFNSTKVKIGYWDGRVAIIAMKCDGLHMFNPGGFHNPFDGTTDEDDPDIRRPWGSYVTEEITLEPGGYHIKHYLIYASSNENGDEV